MRTHFLHQWLISLDCITLHGNLEQDEEEEEEEEEEEKEEEEEEEEGGGRRVGGGGGGGDSGSCLPHPYSLLELLLLRFSSTPHSPFSVYRVQDDDITITSSITGDTDQLLHVCLHLTILPPQLIRYYLCLILCVHRQHTHTHTHSCVCITCRSHDTHRNLPGLGSLPSEHLCFLQEREGGGEGEREEERVRVANLSAAFSVPSSPPELS